MPLHNTDTFVKKKNNKNNFVTSHFEILKMLYSNFSKS